MCLCSSPQIKYGLRSSKCSFIFRISNLIRLISSIISWFLSKNKNNNHIIHIDSNSSILPFGWYSSRFAYRSIIRFNWFVGVFVFLSSFTSRTKFMCCVFMCTIRNQMIIAVHCNRIYVWLAQQTSVANVTYGTSLRMYIQVVRFFF